MASRDLQEEWDHQALLVLLGSLVHKVPLESRAHPDCEEIQVLLDARGSVETLDLLEALEIKLKLEKMDHRDLMGLQDPQEPQGRGGWWVSLV